MSRKVGAYWRPFHQSGWYELGRLKSSHDRVLLLVVHARQWLRNAQERVGFADCTVSTNFGRSADSRLVHALTSQILSSGYSWVLNPAGAGGRHRITRYGNPGDGLHVIELEVGGRLRAEISSLVRRQHVAVEADECRRPMDSLLEVVRATMIQLGDLAASLNPESVAPGRACDKH
ncbi:hypothetical protein BZM26_09810 [Paraburkholderia strydomiana]|nr:hypothetical protein BZM26_09810 [Paraburkholderia strydomiana]